MGLASKEGDWAFKAFTASLGVATVYLGATFSVNVYRRLSWHNTQSKIYKQDSFDQVLARNREQMRPPRMRPPMEVTVSFVMNVGAILLFAILFRYSQVAENNGIGGALFR